MYKLVDGPLALSSHVSLVEVGGWGGGENKGLIM